MKLKKAIKKCRKLKFNFVAVDAGGEIYAFSNRPIIFCECEMWIHNHLDRYLVVEFLGFYSGRKDWKNTLKHVKYDQKDMHSEK